MPGEKNEILIRGIAWIIALTPIWLSALLFRFRISIASGVRRASRVLMIGAVAFFLANTGDRSPMYVEAMLTLMTCGWIMLSAELSFRLTRDYQSARQR